MGKHPKEAENAWKSLFVGLLVIRHCKERDSFDCCFQNYQFSTLNAFKNQFKDCNQIQKQTFNGKND